MHVHTHIHTHTRMYTQHAHTHTYTQSVTFLSIFLFPLLPLKEMLSPSMTAANGPKLTMKLLKESSSRTSLSPSPNDCISVLMRSSNYIHTQIQPKYTKTNIPSIQQVTQECKQKFNMQASFWLIDWS